MLSLRSGLLAARRMLLFIAEQVFLLIEKVWSMQIHSVHHRGDRRPEGREKILFVDIFLVLP